MARINTEIRDQFTFFNELLSELKIVSDSNIRLKAKANNPYWLIGSSTISHNTINEDIVLIVERSQRERKYGIKLRCKTLSSEPFFRFDSDGPAHRNDDPLIPLENQLITTPHFNTYNERGKGFAYKNEVLNREKDSKIIIADINFGISLFCVESNCQLSNDSFPNVIDIAPEIDFALEPIINYDYINFE